MCLQAATLEFLEPAARWHYLPGMRWLLAFSLAIVVAGPVRAEALPPYEVLVAQFERSAIWEDDRVRKHGASVATGFVSDTKQPDFYLKAVKIVLGQIISAAGIDFRPAKGIEDANLVVAMMPKQSIRLALQAHGKTGWETVRCAATAPEQGGTITKALAMIADDIDPPQVRDCAAQEILHTMGFRDAACAYRPSTFCEDEAIFPIPPGDLALLKTLYDPRLKPGMTRAEAMPIVRVILREIVSRAGG
jgi:hypothetical protein